MEFTIYEHDAITIIKVVDNVGPTADISSLTDVVLEQLKIGATKVGIEFTADSLVGTIAISILIKCCELVHSENGKFYIVNPSDTIYSTLAQVGVDKIAGIYRTS